MAIPEDRYDNPDTPGAWVESNNGVLAAGYTEYLRWHHEYAPDALAPICDEDGWLTDAGKQYVARVLETDEEITDVIVEDGDGGDEPHFTASITLDLPATATVDDLWAAAWTFHAAMINVTDPGTFNHVYLFSSTT